MKFFFDRCKFLLSATNHHGVHSPFVYNYVTKGLYDKKKYSPNKSQNVVLKSIAYFRAKQVWLSHNKGDIKKIIQREFPLVEYQNKPFDILYTDPAVAYSIVGQTSIKNEIYNNTVLIVDQIYDNKINRSLWHKIKGSQCVSVTIDLFYCGAVFFRREQVKEHFKIRT